MSIYPWLCVEKNLHSIAQIEKLFYREITNDFFIKYRYVNVNVAQERRENN